MSIFNLWKQVPAAVYWFFLKVLVVFLVWKTIYLYLLLPTRVLDGPLTRAVAVGTTKALNFFTFSRAFSSRETINKSVSEGKTTLENFVDIKYQQQKVLEIADVCNGLELLVLYAGFILCYPAAAYRKMIFIPAGIVLIYLLNILRCTALALIFLHYPDYVDFSHHFLFTVVVYGFIFWLWYIFTQKRVLHAKLQ